MHKLEVMCWLTFQAWWFKTRSYVRGMRDHFFNKARCPPYTTVRLKVTGDISTYVQVDEDATIHFSVYLAHSGEIFHTFERTQPGGRS